MLLKYITFLTSEKVVSSSITSPTSTGNKVSLNGLISVKIKYIINQSPDLIPADHLVGDFGLM